MINAKRGWLWRAVDDAGRPRHLGPTPSERPSGEAVLSQTLEGLEMVPCAIVTDRLASYTAAKSRVLPTVDHLRRWRQNNRVENSHQPVRRREHSLQRFKTLRHAARFCLGVQYGLQPVPTRPACALGGQVSHRDAAPLAEWDIITETTAFSAAA
jgi:putative transposase